jgi:hypothetical protein
VGEGLKITIKIVTKGLIPLRSQIKIDVTGQLFIQTPAAGGPFPMQMHQINEPNVLF